MTSFEPIRRRLKSDFSQKKSEAGDALQRRFASSGMLNSGAYAKQAGIQDQELGKQEQDALSEIDFQEQQEMQRQKEVEAGREFARSERLGSQEFAKTQNEAAQGFQRSEREAGQFFNKQIYDLDSAFKERVFNNENHWRGVEFDQNRKDSLINALTAFKSSDMDNNDFWTYTDRLKDIGYVNDQDLKNWGLR